jgi:hypothetical protein
MSASIQFKSATVEKVRVEHDRLSRDEVIGLSLAPADILIGRPLWMFAAHAERPFYWAQTSPVLEILQTTEGQIEVMTESRSIYRITYTSNDFTPPADEIHRMRALIEHV